MNNTLKSAATNGFLVVLLGAFGAHGLESVLSPDRLETWQTGVHYHMFHTTALFGAAILLRLHPGNVRVKYSAWCFLAGIVLFSGSLYILALTGLSFLGFITPFGGLAFLGGWGLLFIETVYQKHE